MKALNCFTLYIFFKFVGNSFKYVSEIYQFLRQSLADNCCNLCDESKMIPNLLGFINWETFSFLSPLP